MNLQRIKLQGFIGLNKGMGVEAIDLDLSGLSGLVTLEGDNGKGKTTLLENLQPFRSLPSRKGTLKSHCFMKHSFKELWFTMAGDEYRTLVKMDATTTVPDEGFIWKNGESMVNGKVTEFDKYLVNLLGTPNLFFNSIFCAQNSAKLSDLRPAELKALFAEFLKLDRYVNWEKTAKAAFAAYVNAWSDMEALRVKTDRAREALGSVFGNLENAQKLLAHLETRQTESKVKIDNAHNLEAKAKEAFVAQAENKTLLAAALKERITMTSLADKSAADYEGTVQDLGVKAGGLQDETQELVITLADSEKIGAAAKIHDRAERAIEDLELQNDVLDIEITGIKELFQNETDRLKVVNDQIEGIGKDTTVIDANSRMDEINIQIGKLSTRIEFAGSEPEIKAINVELAALKKSAAVLDGIDPGCTSEVCGLIAQSLEDKAAIPGTIARSDEAQNKLVRGFNDEIIAFRNEVAELTKKVEAHVKERDPMLADYQKTGVEIKAVLKTLELDILNKGRQQGALLKDITDWKKTKADAKSNKARLPEILIADARKKDIEKQLDEINKQLDELQRKYVMEGKDRTELMLTNGKEVDRLRVLIDENIEKNLEIAEDEVRAARAEGVKIFEDIVKVKSDIEAAEKNVLEHERLQSESDAIVSVMRRFKDQEAQWSYLADACSKDGLRALEIEGVAPVITAHANEMLSGTFGPNHSVRFQTQDENGKEVLDIVVINDDGSETLLSNLSGGERVWILKALRLAQTLISQEKSGRHFETALMDEEDGALSNENAVRFINLYRRLMEIAKMDACFYISHRPDAIHLADHRIKFKDGGLRII